MFAVGLLYTTLDVQKGQSISHFYIKVNQEIILEMHYK